MTRIFFDTEFTDLAADAELISLGLVTETGDQSFYAELSDWDPAKANDFVRDVVLPLLEHPAVPACTSGECEARLSTWFLQFDSDLDVVSDSDWDWRLLRRLLLNTLVLTGENSACLTASGRSLRFRRYSIRNATEERIHLAAANEWLQGRQHHALADAQALRAGVLAVEASLAATFL